MLVYKEVGLCTPSRIYKERRRYFLGDVILEYTGMYEIS